MLALRYVYVLALVVWLGGMVVLGAIVAPATFDVLQQSAPVNGRELAGTLFGAILVRFQYVAYGAGALTFLALGAMRILGPRPANVGIRAIIVALMIGAALVLGLRVLPQIEMYQKLAGGLPSALPAGDYRRVEFDRLHVASTRLMGFNIFCGLVLLYWEARE